MAERTYTIMIVPGSKAKLLRFKVRHNVLMALLSIGLLSLLGAGLLPIIYYKAAQKSREVSALERENKALKKANKEFDASITSLKEQVTFFETKASKFAAMAGVENLPSSQASGGLRQESPQDPSVFRDEIENLQERSSVLKQSFSLLERAYHDQSLLLSSTPSIAPVQGMIAYGFSWRKDPFTGQRAFHTGLDIVAPKGTRVLAPADGVVLRAGREAGYGNVIYLSHGNGLTTRYGHLDGFAVRAGQEISRGDLIGYIGNTGHSLGAHLHYEVLVNNTKVDPAQYILDNTFSF
jgi:murein DD-endopeptidase MepM/ murein hydrolase activator NlpD